MQTITIPKRFCGPPNSGNGGYVCGMLARHIAGSAEVTLRSPPPLESKLDVVEAGPGQWELRHESKTVATGQAVPMELSRVERATFDEAAAAEQATSIKPHEHLLPMCFVCGPERARGDGLRIFAGPLDRKADDGSVVFGTTWTPYPNLAAEDGLVATEFLWSALDCPTGYVVMYDRQTRGFDRTPTLLGRLSARIDGRPRPGERCVITSWEVGRDGRKRTAEAALFGETGQLLAQSRAVWIAVDRQVQLGRV
jgi:hypothetical protein